MNEAIRTPTPRLLSRCSIRCRRISSAILTRPTRTCARPIRCIMTPLKAYLASRNADVALILRDRRFGKDFAAPHRRALRPRHPGRAGVPQHEPLDADAGPAGSHAAARSRRQGVHGAPGRGHALAHPVDRRRLDRSRREERPDGSDRRLRVPPAGDRDLRHARHSGRGSRDLLPARAHRRTPARSGAAVARRDRRGQRGSSSVRSTISSGCSSCAAASRATI